ncbi:MAG: fasciclin domain-containing protein [Chitinophagaceae bacterium]|nr:fasciclin domain-containing protein [Chitinophagaceae bacterium]
MKKIKIYSLFILSVLVAASCDKRSRNEIYPPAIQDNVLSAAQKEGNLNVFVAAMKLARMDSALQYLGQYTVWAPTDQAFAGININAGNLNTVPIETLRAILRYHIVSGRVPRINLLPGPNSPYTSISNEAMYTSTYSAGVPGSFLNGRRIVKTDILANNGVLHAIGGVLAPPPGNIMQTLEANPNFSFLVAAIDRAGLRSTFASTNVFNLFAPTNTAFQNAGYADIAAIQAANATALSNILRYHVVAAATVSIPLPSPLFLRGRLFSVDLRNGWSLTTVQGTNVTIVTTPTSAAVKGTTNTGNSNITLADIVARNGVIHQIDQVLLP